MPIKHYGIYLLYSPNLDLRQQGLGRYLAALLRGAVHRKDIHFTLVCPSWSRKALKELFDNEEVVGDHFSILSPPRKPFILYSYEFGMAVKNKIKRRSSLPQFYKNNTSSVGSKLIKYAVKRVMQSRSPFSLFFCLLEPKIWLAVLTIPINIAILLWNVCWKYIRKIRIKKRLYSSFQKWVVLPLGVGKYLLDKLRILRLFKFIEQAEIRYLHRLIKTVPEIRAWYVPTAFWPSFTQFTAPVLICVPDIVLSEFPIGFGRMGNGRFIANFEEIKTVLRSGQYYVTYSEAVKWATLVDRFAIQPENIVVIPHAPNDLSSVIIPGLKGEKGEVLLQSYAKALFTLLLTKIGSWYADTFQNTGVKFLFYASQFRPNKNVITLLKAYVYLLRKRFIGHKLILTGNPNSYQPIKEFITTHSLEKEVFFLNGLSLDELAVCYKLADLAVNPSLSEGGCPFTFTEALSVGTPVVMSRIPVSEEVLTDLELQEMTFFDPYSWQDMAHRIEWGLNHREELLAIQLKTYKKLAQRSWTDVVDEHIDALERISCPQESPLQVGGAEIMMEN